MSQELVLAGCSLDQPEYKVSLAEGAWPHSSAVIAAEALLVDADGTITMTDGLKEKWTAYE